VKWIAIMSSCSNRQLKKRRFWDLKLNSQNEWQRENMIKCIWKELVNVRKSYKCDNRACRTRASLGHGRAACVKDYDSALIDVVVGTTRCKISQNPPRQWASSMSMSHFSVLIATGINVCPFAECVVCWYIRWLYSLLNLLVLLM